MNKHILVVDNQDSFVYNLIEMLRHLPGISYQVRLPHRLDDCSARMYDGVLLSPGPGVPSHFPDMMRIIAEADALPQSEAPSILGVCLGLQAIVHHYGGKLRQLPHPTHGLRSPILYSDPKGSIQPECGEETLYVGRYHSWAASETSLPDTLRVTSWSADDRCVMSVEHRTKRVYGVQFHPESIMTDRGREYLTKWSETLR